jgi:hypothetical protein
VVRVHARGLDASMRRRSTAGRPVVTRRMLVRAQPSQSLVGKIHDHSCGRDVASRRAPTPPERVRFLPSVPCDRGVSGSTACTRAIRVDSRRLHQLVVAQRFERHRAKVEDGGSNPPGETFDGGRARERTGLMRRHCLVRLQGRRLSPAPVVEREMTPGSQPGGCGFESRRGYSR